MGRKPIDPQDIIGQRFGKLVVKEYAGKAGKIHQYLCQCDCGKVKTILRNNLLIGHTTSCGCISKGPKIDPQDIIGRRFGKLVVKEYLGKNCYGRHVYLCQCDCGKETSVRRDDLLSGNTKSCGCISKVSNIDPQDIVGKRFGHWTVLEYLGKDISSQHFYMAKCDCGTVQRLRRSNLISGAATSCGCVRGYKPRTQKPVELAKEIHKLVGRQIGPYYVAHGAGLSSIDKETVLYFCLDQDGNEIILPEERLLAV